MPNVQPRIISASRRTDIPAYYADWFRQRLERGFVAYPNPHSGKPVFMSLLPAHVTCFVFWTRNPKPLFKHLDYIDERYQRRHYMHFTINGLPESLEARNPQVDFAVSSAEFLARCYGSDYVQWRFDPIVVSSVTPVDYILAQFALLASRLQDLTQRCYFSFVDLYQKTRRNFAVLERQGISFDPSYTSAAETADAQIALVTTMQQIAATHGITLYACAEEHIARSIPGIKQAHCVDADLVRRVALAGGLSPKDAPTRMECGCIDSRDIGHYDSCPHGCLYCYANMNPDKALENARIYARDGVPMDDAEPPPELARLIEAARDRVDQSSFDL